MRVFFSFLFFSLFNVLVSAQDWQWQNPLPQGNTLNSVYFSNSNVGYAVGEKGTILKTTNGGKNWDMQTVNTTKNLYSVYFTSIDTGYAVGGDRYGVIFKTVNGGANWIAQTIPAWTFSLYSVIFTDSNNGYAISSWGYILKTINGGANWTSNTVQFGPYLHSIYN